MSTADNAKTVLTTGNISGYQTVNLALPVEMVSYLIAQAGEEGCTPTDVIRSLVFLDMLGPDEPEVA